MNIPHVGYMSHDIDNLNNHISRHYKYSTNTMTVRGKSLQFTILHIISTLGLALARLSF